MIIDRYIIREIVKPTVTICTALMCIFGCYMSTRFGEDAINGLLPASSVIQLILLRIIISLEVLLPTTLFFSIIIALGRLYRNSEMIAMFACGISMARVIRSVFLVSIIGGLIVACLSFFIRPWAWNQFFQIQSEAEATFDLTRMKSGNFYKTGQRVIFADEVDPQQNQAKHVFIQTEKEGSLQIIFADQAKQYKDEKTKMPVLEFQRGHLYEFSTSSPNSSEKVLILDFENSAMPLQPNTDIKKKYRIKAVATRELIHSENLEEIAEFQWRLTAPLSIILLGLLAIPLSRSSPRQSKYINIPVALAIFAVYYNFCVLAKKWVEKGVIDVFPGIWWAQLMLGVLVCVLLLQPSILLHWRRR